MPEWPQSTLINCVTLNKLLNSSKHWSLLLQRITVNIRWSKALSTMLDTWYMCLVAQSCPTICNPLDCRLPPGSSVHRIFQARMLEWVAFPPPGDLPNSGIEPCLLCLLHCQVDSLPTEPSGKPNIWWKFPKVSCCYFFLVFVFVVGNSSLGTEWTQSLAIEAGKWDMGPGGKHVRDFKTLLFWWWW